MKTRKILAAALSIIMVIAAIPAASLAAGASSVVNEAAAMSKLENVWAAIDAAEAHAIAAGLDRKEVINAVYETALNTSTVDKDSFSDFRKDGFFFNVDGMYCSYNYRLRNELDTNVESVDEKVVFTPGKGTKNAQAQDVLLVAPYYGHDSSFTNQYKNEAQSIANATGGSYTLIQSTAATGPAIAENYPGKGVVIYDSHGTQSGTSSYLCLTTNSGITSADYNNGWAVNAGSSAYIDGRYIEHHISAPLSDCLVWMAICEGMMRQGQGTTGYALLRAGAGCVYGYSQSVSFDGDYEYEETFWHEMKNGATVADAIQVMKDTHGLKDTYVSPAAWPIVMSPVDNFPANPDSAQTVNCDWLLFGDPEPVELNSFTLDQTDVQLYIDGTASVNFLRVPDNANLYELEWTSANENVATVVGNKTKATITAVYFGRTTVTCTVKIDGEVFGTATVNVDVVEDPALKGALNVEGGNLSFVSGGAYPFIPVTKDGRVYVESSNKNIGNSDSTLVSKINMKAGETMSFEYYYSSEDGYDWFDFSVNDQQKLHLSGTSSTGWNSYTFTAPSDGLYTFKWVYDKDSSVNRGNDCVRIDNVEYSGTQITPDGDLDGNGSVSVNDALIALRIAMKLIEPTVEQLAHGDLNGDGSISVMEALQIQRMALNIAQ